jgi:carboxy-terminal domain RNA polymerase II polypeptide A small phosphatase
MSDTPPLLVVFDLDETLIHSSFGVHPALADFMSGPHPCVVRPYARELISECLDRYRVGVWTSAGSLHANTVVKELFGDADALRFVYSAEQCTPFRDFDTMETVAVKNLHKLRRRGFDLDRVVAIDDSPEKHRRNYGNLLRVKPWTGEQEDDELNDARLYLRWLDSHPSVRQVEKRGWRHQQSWRQSRP